MTSSTVLPIGARVSCQDGTCGELRKVVIDPAAGTVTHLVVEPEHRRGTGHLVPVHLLRTTTPELRLTCTSAEFEALEPAEETQFIPASPGSWGYGDEQVLTWPYYGVSSMGGLGLGGIGAGPQLVVRDLVPVGEVEVSRGEHVHATDGDIGRVEGLVIDVTDHRVSHVLLQAGHLWGSRTVAIPFSSVQSVDSGVVLDLTKQQVKDLPAVDVFQFS